MASEQHESDLRARVLPHTSDKDGHLEDQTLDLDARTMQIMGKRQQLKVGGSVQLERVCVKCFEAEILTAYVWIFVHHQLCDNRAGIMAGTSDVTYFLSLSCCSDAKMSRQIVPFKAASSMGVLPLLSMDSYYRFWGRSQLQLHSQRWLPCKRIP